MNCVLKLLINYFTKKYQLNIFNTATDIYSKIFIDLVNITVLEEYRQAVGSLKVDMAKRVTDYGSASTSKQWIV